MEAYVILAIPLDDSKDKFPGAGFDPRGPIVLDLAHILDLVQRARMEGIQEWLSFYFKSSMTLPELYPEHDLFIQQMKLKNTLWTIMGEDKITHTGLDYYYE